jgi:hypothetical protein
VEIGIERLYRAMPDALMSAVPAAGLARPRPAAG